MSRAHRRFDTKKPATCLGRGLVVEDRTDQRQFILIALLQLHSIFVRGRLLLGQAMDITATQ